TPSQETDQVSPTEVTPELGKGALDIGGLLGRLSGRLDKPGTYADDGFRRRGCGQTGSGRGAYDPAVKPLQTFGRATDGMANVWNRTRETWPSGILGGRRETCAMVRLCTRPQSKERERKPLTYSEARPISIPTSSRRQLLRLHQEVVEHGTALVAHDGDGLGL